MTAPASPSNTPLSTPAAAEQWPHAAVLVVDDEPGMRNFLVKTLLPRTGQVMSAGSAEEAQDLLQRHRFDLVILDITLPGKSGITLLQEMRAQGNPCEVVLITAFADLDTAIEALRAGAGDFLLKPFRVAQVLGACKHAFDRARLKRENWVLRRALSRRTPAADGLVGRSIVVKGLRTSFYTRDGVVRAVDGIDFHVDRGEIMGIDASNQYIDPDPSDGLTQADHVVPLLPERGGFPVEGVEGRKGQAADAIGNSRRHLRPSWACSRC